MLKTRKENNELKSVETVTKFIKDKVEDFISDTDFDVDFDVVIIIIIIMMMMMMMMMIVLELDRINFSSDRRNALAC